VKLALSIAVMAVVTYIIRALPLCLFKKEIKSPWIKSFLYYMPYAVLGAMTFPAIFYCTNSVISASLGFFAAMIMAYMNMGLMPAAVAAVAVVFITELFMH
jgi:branched-subunit amino acid transport protein